MFKRNKSVVDDITAAADWYLKDAKSDAVKAKLRGLPDGSFAIRNSSSEPGKYVLAYQFQGATKNLHIDGESGCKLSKSQKKFDNLSELVRYYSTNDTVDLMCKLVGADLADPKTLKKLAKEKAKKEKQASSSPTPGPPGMVGGAGGKSSEVADKGYGKEWKVQDVCDWLSQMDMNEYVATFKKNKVDGTALLLLDDNDLRELGVGAFGARKKLVKAIQTLNKKFEDIDAGKAAPPPGMRDEAPAPVTTIGLIARNVDGQVKIFDSETGMEVFDIAAHQKRKHEELAAGKISMNGGPIRGPPRTFGPSDHENSEWYDKNMLKAKIFDLLEPLPNGNFVVRDSNTNPGCYAFSIVFNGKVKSKMIEPSAGGGGGLHFKGSTDIFPNLSALVDHYTRTQGGILECPLVYPAEGSRPMRIAALPYWNCMDLDKASALAKIKGKPAGAFVIRPSDKSYAALSLIKPDGGTYNQHIDETPSGLQLKKSSISHANLDQFVNYYSQRSQSDLPCPLTTNL